MRRSFHLVRILILYILLEYNHGLKRKGCFIDMSTIRVKSRITKNYIPKKIKLLDPDKLQPELKTLEGCAQKCSSSTDTCYIMMFREDYNKCYIGGVGDFIFEPVVYYVKERNYTSYINLCGHRNSGLDDGNCYHQDTVSYVQSINIIRNHSLGDCTKNCNHDTSCYGLRYHLSYGGRFVTCETYVKNYADITLEFDGQREDNSLPNEHTYRFKKCDTCFNNNCQHGGTCVPTTGTCCNYTCNCTDVNMVGDCDRCVSGLGIDKVKGECKSCGDKEIGNGTDCIPCDGDMVANWNNTECATPPPTNKKNVDKENGVKWYVVVIPIMLILVLVGLGLAFYFFYWKKRKTDEPPQPSPQPPAENPKPPEVLLPQLLP